MSTAFVILGIATLIGIFWNHARLARGLRRPRELARKNGALERSHWPRVAVLRPIKGLDPGARENLDALLDSVYPGPIEFVFLLDDARDPSYPIVQDAIARHPERAATIVLTGEPPPLRTGKIHKMIRGADSVDADILAFCDSDTRPGPTVLDELVTLLDEDDARGIAFAPTVAMSVDARLGDVGYALLHNAWYGAAVDRVAGDSGKVPFAMGQFMLIRRTALDAIGTMRAAEGELVDDMFLGRRMNQFGFENVMGRTRVPIIIGGMRLGEFVRVFRKWIFFSQSGLPTAFKTAGWLRAVPGFAGWLSLIAGVAFASPAVVVAGVLAIGAFVFSQVRLSRVLGGTQVAPRHYWLAAILPFLAAGVAASTKLNHDVAWRGRRYHLDRSGRLRPIKPRPPIGALPQR